MEEEPVTSAHAGGSKRDALNLPAGTIVSGNYILFDCLGRSGRSAVYKTRHKDLEGPFLAMKILHPSLNKNQEAAARFHQEVVASYNVTHPNVVRTHEFINDGTTIAYTMEYMEYGTLKDRLDQNEPLQIGDITTIAEQLCHGLSAIHRAGIVHRNVKPGNIFFSADGLVKIADFGIARTGTGPRLTSAGVVLGTIGYSSPEYLETGEVDHRSDIYALGMLLYEMIVGKYPFENANPVESLRLRLTTDPESPSAHRPECPARLSAIVQKALNRSPAARFQSADEIIAELNREGRLESEDPPAPAAAFPVEPAAQQEPAGLQREQLPSIEQGRQSRQPYYFDEDDVPASQFLKNRLHRQLAFGALLSGVFVALALTLFWTLRSNAPPASQTANAEAAKSTKGPAEAAKPAPGAVEAPQPSVQAASAANAGPAGPAFAASPDKRGSDPEAEEASDTFANMRSTWKKEEKPQAREKQQAPQESAGREYVVVPGDTLGGIALRFGVSIEKLMELNQISEPRKLQAGAVLQLP